MAFHIATAQSCPDATRQYEEWRAASVHDCWPWDRAALATDEDIRRAHELRLQLRERCQRRSASQVAPWCIGVE
jgi:hypothetical protein